MKVNILLVHTTTWMNLKEIMLSERKPNLKTYMLYDSVYVSFSKRQIYRDGKYISYCQRLWVTEGVTVKGQHEEFWGVIKLCYVLIMRVGIQTCTCDEVLKAVCAKKETANFTVCKIRMQRHWKGL